jgi:hypothetical protein
MTAFGMAALVMGIYLWLSWDRGVRVGSFMTLALLGSAVISYLLTIYADRIGSSLFGRFWCRWKLTLDVQAEGES